MFLFRFFVQVCSNGSSGWTPGGPIQLPAAGGWGATDRAAGDLAPRLSGVLRMDLAVVEPDLGHVELWGLCVEVALVLGAMQNCPSAAAEFCTVAVLWVLDVRPREIAAAAPSFHQDSVLPEEQASSALAIWLKAPMSSIQSWRDATGLCDGVTLGWSASRCLAMIGRHDAGGEGDRLGGRGRIARLLKGSQRVMADWPARRCRLPNIRCCHPLAVRSRGRCRR